MYPVKACCFFWIAGESVLLPVLPAHPVPWIQAMYFFLLVSLPEIAQGSLRISLDISNTEEEIDYMLEVIPQVVEQLAECQMIGGKSIARIKKNPV